MTPEPDLVPSRRDVVVCAGLGILASLMPLAKAQAGNRGPRATVLQSAHTTLSDQPQASGDLKMSAYAIFIREHTRNKEEMQNYAALVTPILGSIDASVLAAYGPQQVLEGPAPEGVVIVKFPSVEAARAFYDSPEYQAARHHRFLGADFRAIIVKGLDA